MTRKGDAVDRRTVLKIGGIGAAAGLAGLPLLGSRGARAAATLQVADAADLTTADGSFTYVAYGLSPLRFEWSGMDDPATHGRVEKTFRVYAGGQEATDGWTDGGTDQGALGDGEGGAFAMGDTGGWGGANDGNSGPGREGWFEFNFGGAATTGAGGGLYAPVSSLQPGTRQTVTDARGREVTVTTMPNAITPSELTPPADGEADTYEVRLRTRCSAWDGDPASGGSELGAARAQASFEASVTNEPATGDVTASGSATSG
jgi:hypothetical protein